MGKDDWTAYKSWPRYAALTSFYERQQGRLVWAGRMQAQQQLLALLKTAYSFGLQEGDYQPAFLQRYQPGQPLASHDDSVDADIRLSDAALHFFSELKTGNKAPAFGYAGLPYAPGAADVAEDLAAALAGEKLSNLATAVQPTSPGYASALGKLRRFLRVAAENGFSDATVASTKVDSTNQPLLRRLYQLGFSDSVNTGITKKELVEKLKAAQTAFDLFNDGVLRTTTIAALNVPLQRRIEELQTAINFLRWLEPLKQRSAVLVLNLPSAGFTVWENGKAVLSSRVIAGKKSTPTPTLSSTITEVILYPYWNVPHKIATTELLPQIKRNIGFLDAGNFQVINSDGRAMNPYKINWRGLSSGYFPYTIRQSTGCDNALGLVKFNFYNPFTVYLHDTPNKLLFASSRRFYSHGCMRVEKPEELAHYLLGSNRIAIDTLTAKGCIRQQSPVTVAAEKKLPVVILYSTAWPNEAGEIRFYGDVYGKLPRSAAPVAYKQ